jgi:hypothetical protein
VDVFIMTDHANNNIKEVKNCRLSIRHFRHVKKRAKAKKALTRLRTITNKLIRELQRKLPTPSLFETYQKDFLFYQQVLAQQPTAVFNLFNIGSALFNAMTLCQLIKAIDDFNGKFSIGGVGDVFFLYGGVNLSRQWQTLKTH